MKIHFATLETCSGAEGVVIVVDVCRAFTTAAYAFHSGAERILLAGTPEEALALRGRFPGSLAMGEVKGLPVPMFDLWNSPSQMQNVDLRGKTLIQRTSAGTQGLIRSRKADFLFAGSFAIALATVRAVRQLNPRTVTFVITGERESIAHSGIEDHACADYMAALLRQEKASSQSYMDWENVYRSIVRLQDMSEPLRSQFEADLVLCKKADCFPWALPVRREDGLLVMDKVNTG